MAGDLIVATVGGIITIEAWVVLWRELLASARPAGITRFLIDCRGATAVLGTRKLDRLPGHLAAIGVAPGDRAAVLHPEHLGRVEFEYYESALRIQGMAQRVFPDAGAALAWLDGDADPGPAA